MHHPVASWCVVVVGGQGVVLIVHEGYVREGGWLLVVGGGDIPRDLVPEVAEAGHPGNPCFPFPLFAVPHIGFYDIQKSQKLQHTKKHPFK